MDIETFKSRAALLETDPKARISKDSEKKLHVCLVDWEELDEISEIESRLTGKKVDYKQRDRDNVIVLEKLLRD